ncbi:MAG TPA: 23S rRNA (adenine(2503)-C(2))-methyltransferase RlmN [Terriglobales bacterium]|nr:23S rRNA (adenine(2503)-C(2))-methyltransferase RlmN [Terriglobales bacterium]
MSALGLELEEWRIEARRLNLPTYRGEQVFRALQQEAASTWSAVRQLTDSDRALLADAHPLRWPEIVQRLQSSDGTVRYLLRLEDAAEIEAVFLPDEEFDSGGRLLRRRTTFCLSSQAGCAVNCRFCLTATLGLKRSLTAAEIVAQVLLLLREHDLRPGKGLDRVNLVFMGMGEPFLNYENVVRAIRVLTQAEGAGIAPRRITVSTSGIVDKIRRWGTERFPRGRPRLAISLNASTDAQRQELMPLNRAQGGLTGLMQAVRELPLAARDYVTFEYVLLSGVNDSDEDAAHVRSLLQGIPSKVNLIAWNSGPGLGFAAPHSERVLAFQRSLIQGGVPTYIRRPRGSDIYAACGQLAKLAVT